MIYGILSDILSLIILPVWIIAGIFKPKLLKGLKEKMGFYPKSDFNSPIVFYGVSVGEVLAIENLIKKVREIFPSQQIVVMTGTATGQEIAKKKLSNTVDFITYFPLDFPIFVKRMIKKINPKIVFIAETELWPNFAYLTNKNNIKTFIINARLSDRTFNSYKKLKFLFKPVLKNYTSIFPQSRQDCEKFITLGADKNTTKIMGNLKFDIKRPDISSLDIQKHTPTIIAGSTHTGEDEIILDSFVELKKEIKDLKLLIAPRHLERCEKVFKLMTKTGLKCKLRSQKDYDADIILIDTTGELGKLYSICDVAFIGGSFNKTGGHNPLEATVFAKPVISGNCIHNFKDIYAILTSCNAAKVVNTKDELTEELRHLLTNKTYYDDAVSKCEKVFEENAGALKFVTDVLQTII